MAAGDEGNRHKTRDEVLIWGVPGHWTLNGRSWHNVFLLIPFLGPSGFFFFAFFFHRDLSKPETQSCS